ncbi:MAG: PilW family protein [Pseudomonadota bacterium]
MRESASNAQRGVSMVELMVALTLGLLVGLAATALLIMTKSAYVTQEEGSRLRETGRSAMEAVSRAVRQAAHENWDREASAGVNDADLVDSISGLDASSLKEYENGIDYPLARSVNGSDVLAVRFTGSGLGPYGDETMFNCGGFGVAEVERGWSIFYVAADKSGEPELRCKYRGVSNWNSEAIARGVESFQILYGIDSDTDGLPNRYVSAKSIEELDKTLVLAGPNAAARSLDKNRKTHWKKIVAVKIALLVRGSQNAKAAASENRFDLFGKYYSDMHGAMDEGVSIDDSKLTAATRNRLRKIFTSTIHLRNQSGGGAT